ncbi:hypothetical protein EDC04DRAFT_2605774 [Pisolithus marmoratus]|nr:hypothetical protein EDC04DRAFT_2605774 [Pisolithus marmoratus]
MSITQCQWMGLFTVTTGKAFGNRRVLLFTSFTLLGIEMLPVVLLPQLSLYLHCCLVFTTYQGYGELAFWMVIYDPGCVHGCWYFPMIGLTLKGTGGIDIMLLPLANNVDNSNLGAVEGCTMAGIILVIATEVAYFPQESSYQKVVAMVCVTGPSMLNTHDSHLVQQGPLSLAVHKLKSGYTFQDLA